MLSHMLDSPIPLPNFFHKSIEQMLDMKVLFLIFAPLTLYIFSYILDFHCSIQYFKIYFVRLVINIYFFKSNYTKLHILLINPLYITILARMA